VLKNLNFTPKFYICAQKFRGGAPQRHWINNVIPGRMAPCGHPTCIEDFRKKFYVTSLA